MPTHTNRNVIVVAVVAVFFFTVAGVVALAIAVPDGAVAGSLIALLVAALPATIATVVSLAKLGQVAEAVDDLGNGAMDAKIRAGLADVLPDELISDDARPVLERDRARRRAGNARHTPRHPRPSDPEDIA